MVITLFYYPDWLQKQTFKNDRCKKNSHIFVTIGNRVEDASKIQHAVAT